MVGLGPAWCWAGVFSNQNWTEGFLCHMCPLKTHVTNLYLIVESHTGNSSGSLTVLCQANTDYKNWNINWSHLKKWKCPPKNSTAMRSWQKNDKCVLSLALPPLPPASLTTSSTSSLLVSLCWIPLIGTTVHHAGCLGSFDPHSLVHLPCHRWLKRFKDLRWKIWPLCSIILMQCFQRAFSSLSNLNCSLPLVYPLFPVSPSYSVHLPALRQPKQQIL